MVFRLTSYIIKTPHQTGVPCFPRMYHATKSAIVSGVWILLAVELDAMSPTPTHILVVARLAMFVKMHGMQGRRLVFGHYQLMYVLRTLYLVIVRVVCKVNYYRVYQKSLQLEEIC